MSDKTIEERYSEWLAILPRGTTVNPYKAWVAAFEREVAPLRKRLVEAEDILIASRAKWHGYERKRRTETDPNEREVLTTYMQPTLQIKMWVDNYFKTHKPLEEKK